MKNTILETKIKEMKNNINEETTKPMEYVSPITGKIAYGNHKQRRQMKKNDIKMQKKINRYVKEHPEAVKVELDEDVIEQLETEEKEKEKTDEVVSEDTVDTVETENVTE